MAEKPPNTGHVGADSWKCLTSLRHLTQFLMVLDSGILSKQF